jgi:hypothetical protein
MDVLVDNTVIMVTNHFSPDYDNEAQSTHGLYGIFCLEYPPEHTGEVCWFHCGTPRFFIPFLTLTGAWGNHETFHFTSVS